MPSAPGKRRVVERCREEIEHSAHDGRITTDQGQALLHILAGTCQPAA
jgi:hypothetical protein